MGYGLKNDQLWQIFSTDHSLYHVWKWVESRLMTSEKKVKSTLGSKISAPTSEEDLINSHDPQRLFGVRSLLMQPNVSQSQLTTKSDVVVCNEVSNDSKNLTNKIIKKYYKSNDRKKALLHCGWDSDFDDDTQNVKLIEELKTKGQYTRAAAVLIFGGGKIKKAINTLKMAAEAGKDKSININLSAIALALSGYTKEADSLWREMCKTILVQLSDPYLRAIFTFLTTDSDRYSEILEDTKLDISDRIAFACIYLSDSLVSTVNLPC